MRRRRASADDPDLVDSVCVYNDQRSPLEGLTDCHKPGLYLFYAHSPARSSACCMTVSVAFFCLSGG